MGLSQWLSCKEFACSTGDTWDADSILGQEDPLEEGMAAHSRILAGKIPWTEEPGRIQFMWLQSQRWLSTHAGLLGHMFAGNLKRCPITVQTRAIQSHDLSRRAWYPPSPEPQSYFFFHAFMLIPSIQIRTTVLLVIFNLLYWSIVALQCLC